MRFTSLSIMREGNPVVTEGFVLTKEPFLHVRVGLENRDGKVDRVSLRKDLFSEYSAKEDIQKGSFLKTENGTLLIIDEQADPYPRVGVLLYAQPGFRGASEIRIEKDSILSRGQIWDSPDGSIGTGDVVLTMMKPGDKIEIFRTGRPAMNLPWRKHREGLYGASPAIVVTLDNDLKFHAMSKEEAEKENDRQVGKGEVL